MDLYHWNTGWYNLNSGTAEEKEEHGKEKSSSFSGSNISKLEIYNVV